MAVWLGLILSVFKLLGSLADYASETRQKNESDAAALGRVLSDAKTYIDRARSARAAINPADVRKHDSDQRD